MSDLILYTTEDGAARINLRVEASSVWLTQLEIAELFQTTKQNVSLHAKNIFEDGELHPMATVKESLTVQTEGNRRVKRAIASYNLELILAIGYRIRSPRGTQFRQWASKHLKEFLVKGFVMDDERLKNPAAGDYFDELLARIRDIRSSERRFYQKILDIYATSVDYTPNAEASQHFFAVVQNKMHWATHGHTAAEVIAQRADATKPFMGLQTTRPDGLVRKDDVVIAKNYLTQDELEVLNRIVSVYIEFAELQALERKQMTMQAWIAKLDDFLKISGRELLDHAGKISADSAKAKAELEYANYRAHQESIPKSIDADFEQVTTALKNLPKPAKKPTKARKP